MFCKLFTEHFPRANIYELITPDILHQIIKGVFKDHLVKWTCKYLEREHGKAGADSILDEIDRRYVELASLLKFRLRTITGSLWRHHLLDSVASSKAAISNSGWGMIPGHL